MKGHRPGGGRQFTSQNPSDDQVRRVTGRFRQPNVSERERFDTSVGSLAPRCVDGHNNNPGENHTARGSTGVSCAGFSPGSPGPPNFAAE